MDDRPGLPPQQPSSGEPRSLTSLNPIARMAAMTAQANSQPTTPATPTPPTPAAPTGDEASARVQATSAPPNATSPAPAAGAVRTSVGKLTRVDASTLWSSGTSFAAWLRDNLDALGDVLSIRLLKGDMPHPEIPVVMADDATGGLAVIVTELGEATDEGFGRLVRNVAASDATHAVWVCGDPGEEYGASVSWLNRAVDARVSMVKVSGVTIGESAAAPMFELKVRTPRADDAGMEADVPAADGDDLTPTTRRVNDWLDAVGTQDEAS